MTEGHRLRGLQMGEAGHHRLGMLQRARHQSMLKGRERRIGLVDDVADIETEIGRNLIVARTRGVQSSGRSTDQLPKPALHIHVNVLKRPLEIERFLADL